MEKLWMIISWKHNGILDGAYGRLLTTHFGTKESAIEASKWYGEGESPIGIIEAVL